MIVIVIIWTDDDLIKIRLRDPITMDKLYKEYNAKVFSFILYRTNGNRELAAEIFSDTFYKVLEFAPKLKSVQNLQSWLLQIAKNKIYDHTRSVKRETTLIEDRETEEIEHEEKTEFKDSEEKLVMVNIAMGNLKEKYRNILELKYNQNKTQKELVQLLTLSEGAVESLIIRAKEALRKELKKLSKDFL